MNADFAVPSERCGIFHLHVSGWLSWQKQIRCRTSGSKRKLSLRIYCISFFSRTAHPISSNTETKKEDFSVLFFGWKMGLEPTTNGTTIHYSNQLSYVHHLKHLLQVLLFVGVAGFEPTTPCSQSRCANRTALHPEKSVAKLQQFFSENKFSPLFLQKYAIFQKCHFYKYLKISNL